MDFVIQPMDLNSDLVALDKQTNKGCTINTVEECGCIHNTVPQCACAER